MKKPLKTTQKPPSNLQVATRTWWHAVMSEYVLQDHHVQLLNLACIALDRARQARAVLDKDGLTFLDRFARPCARPEILIERGAVAQFEKLVRALGLDVADTPSANRLPPPMPKIMGR